MQFVEKLAAEHNQPVLIVGFVTYLHGHSKTAIWPTG